MANQPPVGFRFMPDDKQLLVYLMRKIEGQQLPSDKIQDFNVYRHNPQELHDMYYRANGEDVSYFFTLPEKNHKGEERPYKDGFWRPSTSQQKIFHDQLPIGFRRTLAYRKGKPGPNAEKTSWIMHEYYIATDEDDMNSDDLVLCKIYMAKGLKRNKGTRSHPYARPTKSKRISLLQ